MKALLVLLLPLLVLGGTVKVIFVAEPGTSIFVNASFVGTIGESGKLAVSFNIGNTFLVSADSPWYVQLGEPEVVRVGEDTIVFINMAKASRLRILSNVYPVSVYIDGEYWGAVSSPDDTLKVPAGYREVVVKASGMEEWKEKVALEWRKVTSVSVELKPLPKVLRIYLSSPSFSPNGDWYQDTLTIHVYSTFGSTATLEISSASEVVLKKDLILKAGDNVFVWNGEGARDGVYTIRVRADGLEDSKEVKVDRSVYTYKKEITLGLLILLMGLTAAVVYFGK